MSLRDKVQGQSQPEGQSDQSDFSTLIDIDLTADYESGKDLINRRVKAFGEGMRDQLQLVRGVMKDFSGGQFVVNEATYQRPALLPSPEDSRRSIVGLLFPAGSYEVETDD